MSLELTLQVDAAPLERARADLLVAPLFAGERPLRGSASRADWRLCGKLSALVAQGRLAGQPGEAALVASFGGLRAPLLLVLGAGPRAAFDAGAYRALVGDAVRRALALRVRRLALPFPGDAPDAEAPERLAEALLAGAAQAVGAARPPVALGLKLLVAREELARTAELLRRARPGPIPEQVALRLPTRATGVPSDAAGRDFAPRGTQLIK